MRWHILIYLFIIFVVGLWSECKMKSVSEFSVAHRSYSSFVLFATLSASFVIILSFIYCDGQMFGINAIVVGVIPSLLAFCSNHVIEKKTKAI